MKNTLRIERAIKEITQQELAEAEERWLYLTDLVERIEAQKKG